MFRSVYGISSHQWLVLLLFFIHRKCPLILYLYKSFFGIQPSLYKATFELSDTFILRIHILPLQCPFHYAESASILVPLILNFPVKVEIAKEPCSDNYICYIICSLLYKMSQALVFHNSRLSLGLTTSFWRRCRGIEVERS